MIGSVLDTVIANEKSSPASIAAEAIPKWAWLAVLVCGVVILWFTFKDIQEPLLDRHSHRQTQTAISVHYMLSEGAWFPYLTPVLGPPWSIPMEFPLYQWIVAVVVKVTGLPLELAGRLVSLAFWWLALFELFRALRHFVPGQSHRAVLLLLLAAAPTSIYWSRSFLIETCALYLSVAYGGRVLSAMLEGKSRAWVWAVIFGSLAALQKITTLFVMEVLIGLGLVVWCVRRWKKIELRRVATKNLLFFCLLGGWTIAVGMSWSLWTDGVKEQNAIAREIITAKVLKDWNYGTLQQRLAPATWKHLASNITLGLSGNTLGLGYKVPLLLWVMMLFLTRRRLTEVGILLLAFMAGPLVFLNLYFIHEYYLVANGYLLLLAFGTAAVAAWEDSRRWVQTLGCVFLGVFIAGELYAYPRYYSLLMAEVPQRRQFEKEFREMLDVRMEPAEILLVYGREWDSSVAFYAQRKAIIDESNWSPADKRMQEMLVQLKPEERIGAMIVNGKLRTNRAFLQARIKAFGLETQPLASYWGDIYFRKPDATAK